MFQKRLCCLGALLALLCGYAFGQTTFASITGTVTDSTGAVVPNAKVTVTNLETNIRSTATSRDTGDYTIAQLNQGTYSVRVEAAGFKEFVAQNVVLVARDVRRVDAKMEVGALETAIEVTGGATLIETETARITDTKTSVVLNTLPLNTRGVWSYIFLAPNVQQQAGSSVVRFAGSRVNENNWAIDGISFADGVDNTQTGPFGNYIESFQEVRIDLSNNSAEFGSMGQMTIVSKSGTNSLHGSAFDYYSTPWFRAKGFFDTARGTGIRHAPGWTVSGPALLPKIYDGRNKTFFFFSYETSRGSQVTQNLNATVPTPAWKLGDFSGLATTIRDPFSSVPFGGNKIPASRINSVSQKLQDKFYPAPNYGDPNTYQKSNFRLPIGRPYDPSTYWTTRIDHHFSDRDQVFGRYTWQRLWVRSYEGNLPAIGKRYQRRDDRAATVSYTHTFRPSLINELRWGFGLNNNPINFDSSKCPQRGLELVKELGLVGLAPDLPDVCGIFNVTFSGSTLTGFSQYNWTPLGYRTHTEEVQEHLSWFRGRHNLKYGFNLLRSEFDERGADNRLFGNAQFSNRFTGHYYADFLMGIPTTVSRSFPPVGAIRNRWSYDFFAMDDFKLSPKLTLNFGLRYELHLNWKENSDRIAIFDVTSGKIVVPDGAMSKVSSIFPKSYVGIAEASSVGLPPRTLIQQDKNNIAPRLGIAWRPWDNRTVFRAGWGMFYNVVPFVYALSFGGSPFVMTEPSYTNQANDLQVIFPRVFPASSTGGPSDVGLPTAQNPGYRTPYSMQYNFTIERQQGNTGIRLSYVGTGMRKAPWIYNYNSPIPNNQPFIDKARPFPNFPDISYATNGAGHQYNGFTAEVTRQLSGGLYLQSSWTWARDRYDMDWNWDLDWWQYTSENPFDRKREVGPAMEIPTHRFTTNYIYQLPFGRGRHWGSQMSRLANLAVGGWELSGIFTVQTGQFLTPLWTGPDPVGIAYTDGDPAEVTIRPDLLSNPNLARGVPTIRRWFDTKAFAPPADGRFGTSGKGVIKGPGVNVWSMGLHKDFIFTERARLRWEITATNIFNHPNWANPATDITDTAGLGTINGVAGVANDPTGARNFRMGVRMQW